MADSYMREQAFTPVGESSCDRHRISQYGMFDRHGLLVAYTVIHRSGELALVSQILGHGEHLAEGVMHLLMVETYRAGAAARRVPGRTTVTTRGRTGCGSSRSGCGSAR